MFIVVIIGKVFLILLLILACILAAVLFLPAFYEISLDLDEKTADVRVNWLFRLVRFYLHVRDSMEAVLSIFFFQINFTDPEAKKKRQRKKAKKQARKSAGKRKKLARNEKKISRKREKQKKKYQKEKEKRQPEAQNSCDNAELVQNAGEQNTCGKADGDFGRKQEKKDAAVGTERSSGKGKETIKQVSGYAKSAKRIIDLVKKYDVISIVWPRLFKFLMHIRPRKLEGCVKFGFADPAVTGKVVGAIAMIPLFYQTGIQIIPDFETEEGYIQGNVYIRGHILLIHVLVLVLGLIREKKLRKFIGAVRTKKIF